MRLNRPMKMGDRVRIRSGRYAGRVGVIVKECGPPFAELVYVLLDRRGRERTDKREMTERRDLEIVEAANAM